MTAIAQRPLIPPHEDLTTLERVREVSRQPDPVVRNLQITQSYHELSLVLARCFEGPALLGAPASRRPARSASGAAGGSEALCASCQS